jgi:hypothetical protein
VTLYDEAGNATLMSITSGSTTIATICTNAANAINAIFTAGNTASPFYAVLAAAGSTTVTLTARTAGIPIYCSVTTTEAGGGAADSQTLTSSVTTANVGPSDWNTAANYSTGAVPVASDDVYITSNAAAPILYGLFQNTALTALSSIALSSLRIEQGHPQIGTLAAPLCIQYSTLDYGAPPADGTRKTSAQICNLKPGAIAVNGKIRSTNSQGSNGRPPVQISVNHASAVFSIFGSSIAGFGTGVSGESGQAATITVDDTAKVTIGSGITLGILNPEGGTTNLSAGVTTINYGVGAVNVSGSGNITTATIGGKFVWESSGTITTLAAVEKGQASIRSGTATNASVSGENATIINDSGIPLSATFTNGVDCINGADSTQVNFGSGLTVTPSAL